KLQKARCFAIGLNLPAQCSTASGRNQQLGVAARLESIAGRDNDIELDPGYFVMILVPAHELDHCALENRVRAMRTALPAVTYIDHDRLRCLPDASEDVPDSIQHRRAEP